MEDFDFDTKKALYVAGGALATAAAAYAGYYVYGRWIYDPEVNGERVLKSNAPELLAVWRYHQWFGACDERTFRNVLQVRCASVRQRPKRIARLFLCAGLL